MKVDATERELLINALPALLAMFGGALQWLMRQWKVVHEAMYHVVAVLLAAAAYVLTVDLTKHVGWQLQTVNALLAIGGYTSAVWGGTFIADSAAKVSSAVPTANSK